MSINLINSTTATQAVKYLIDKYFAGKIKSWQNQQAESEIFIQDFEEKKFNGD